MPSKQPSFVHRWMNDAEDGCDAIGAMHRKKWAQIRSEEVAQPEVRISAAE